MLIKFVEMELELPAGFRFHPTDEELITHYLYNKLLSPSAFSSPAIADDVNFNNCEPSDLPGKAKMGDKEWYFFSVRDRKYPTGLRTNRATKGGYWKATGKDKQIFKATNLVGMKKTLVFYKGRAPTGQKSNWVMHEYRLEGQFSACYRLPTKSTQKEWVICRVMKRKSGGKKENETALLPAALMESDASHVTCFSNSMELQNDDVTFWLGHFDKDQNQLSSYHALYHCLSNY